VQGRVRAAEAGRQAEPVSLPEGREGRAVEIE